MASRTIAKSRALEMTLWAAAVFAGAFVLVPALADWIEASHLEDLEKSRAKEAGHTMDATAHKLEWTLADPQADRKITERQALDARKALENDQKSD